MTRRRVVLLTARQTRHLALAKALAAAPGVDLAGVVTEDRLGGWTAHIAPAEEGEAQRRHLTQRDQAEEDFFGLLVKTLPPISNEYPIETGTLNAEATAAFVESTAPDILAAYGCGIVKDPLLTAYAGRIVNVHLGLSPYYRGAGTNFWALANGEPEYVGATFMKLDAGVDTGEIIHQLRARIRPGDTPHTIGNRLIADVIALYGDIVRRWHELDAVPQPPAPVNERYYRRSDWDADAVEMLYRRFDEGMLDNYLEGAEQRVAAAPIVEHPGLRGHA